MDTDNEQFREGNLEEKELTYRIRACVFAVSNELGPGFTGIKVGLLINFGQPRGQIKRFVR